MKIHECKQGSDEWRLARTGIPTSSRFSDIITASGKPSQSAERYMCTLIAERFLGEPIEEHISLWQQRGQGMEQEAVEFYELQRDMDTQPVGFITDDDDRWGASPDRLVSDIGLLEIKCPAPWVHIASLLEHGKAYKEHLVQCQGQLWVTGREWVDLLSYHPALPPALIRIGRDEEFIRSIALAVEAFSRVLEEQWALCISRGWVSQKPKESHVKTASEYMKEALLEMQKK